MGRIFIGTSGYNYKDWRGVFYPKDLPEKDWLSFYSKHFDTLEINATFYRSFPRAVFENWGGSVREGFAFSIKGSRFITHIKRLKNVEGETRSFFSAASSLEEKLSCVLWQFPSSFKNTIENKARLASFLSLLPIGIKYAFEFRDESWFNKDIEELLEDKNATIVINSGGYFPVIEKHIGRFSYIRFHGPAAIYASSYSREELADWAKRIGDYARFGDVYCYFNNDVSGYAVKNAKELKELVASHI